MPNLTPVDYDPFTLPEDAAIYPHPPQPLQNFGRAAVDTLKRFLTLPKRALEASEQLRTEGQYDPEPAAELMQAMAGRMPFAETGTAGIFGGRLAAENLAARGIDQPKLALRMADFMEGQGLSRDEIYRVTSKMLQGTPYAGVSKGAEGKWRFEIPDNESSLINDHMPAFGKPAPVASQFSHPDLFQAYPDLENTLMRQEASLQRRGAYTPAVTGALPVVRVEAPNVYEARDVLLHELQHDVQHQEGFGQGASPSAMLQLAERTYGPRSSMTDHAYNNAAAAAHEAYLSHAGEVEARNVQARRDMTPDERRASPPWTTEDVPRDQQIVRGVTVTPVAYDPFGS